MSKPKVARAVLNQYEALEEVLDQAWARAAIGKGADRHGDLRDFEQQDAVQEARVFGIGPHMYQIRKKAKEVTRLGNEGAKNELLDIIVYAAAAYLAIEMIEQGE